LTKSIAFGVKASRHQAAIFGEGIGESSLQLSTQTCMPFKAVLDLAFIFFSFSILRRETVNIYSEMLQSEGWDKQEEVFIPNIKQIALKVSVNRLMCTP